MRIFVEQGSTCVRQSDRLLVARLVGLFHRDGLAGFCLFQPRLAPGGYRLTLQLFPIHRHSLL
jgi:hypothetical protein